LQLSDPAKRKLLVGIVAGLLLFSFPSLGWGQPNQKDQKQAEAKKIKRQVEQIDQELDEAVEDYNQANLKLSKIKAEFTATSQKLEKAQQDLDDRRNILNTRLCNIYKHGEVPFIETIFSTKTFGQFLLTLSRLQDIAAGDARIVGDIERLKKDVEEKRHELAEQEKSQKVACSKLNSNKSEIEKKLGERKNTLAGVEEEINALDREEQANAERLRAQVEQEQVEQRRARTPQVSRGTKHVPVPKSGAVGVAMQQLGKPYCWGGAGPGSFDCSGLVMYCYAKIGVSLPHSAAAQYGCGTHISRDQLRPGDLVFFTRGRGISHVGMYVGGDSYIHAPRTGDVVKISSLSARGRGYVGGVRP